MEQLEKHMLNLAFHEVLKSVCECPHSPPGSVTIGVRVLAGGIVRCAKRQENQPEKALKTSALVTRRMIALRLGLDELTYFFRCVHFAFRKDQNTMPESISMVLYFSKLACCPCIGILENEKPFTALRIADLFDTMNIGKELLN